MVPTVAGETTATELAVRGRLGILLWKVARWLPILRTAIYQIPQ